MNPLRKSIGFALLAVLAASAASAWAGWFSDPTWDSIHERIAKEFPSVTQISTAQLADWLAAHNRPQPVLLDTRSAQEYAVSHLPGAIWMDPKSKHPPEAVPKKTPIVLYCSVGYRSSRAAAQLKKSGYVDVRNLQGSIFQWANESRPVINAKGPTKLVHPYNKSWGTLLKPELRSPL